MSRPFGESEAAIAEGMAKPSRAIRQMQRPYELGGRTFISRATRLFSVAKTRSRDVTSPGSGRYSNQHHSDWRAIKSVECFGLFFFRETGMALQQPGAAVPAKNSIVVPRGTNQFGFREAVHRLREKWGKSVRRASRGH